MKSQNLEKGSTNLIHPPSRMIRRSDSFYVSEGCWMEGQVDQRITKVSQAKNTNYRTNRFNITQIKPVLTFGSTSGKYPEERSVNMAPGLCWTIVTDKYPGDVFSLNDTEEVVVEVNVNDVPETGDVMPSEEEQLIEEQAP